MAWPFVLETQLSKQSGEGRASLTMGKRSHAQWLRLRVPNENFRPNDNHDPGLESQSHPSGSSSHSSSGCSKKKERNVRHLARCLQGAMSLMTTVAMNVAQGKFWRLLFLNPRSWASSGWERGSRKTEKNFF